MSHPSYIYRRMALIFVALLAGLFLGGSANGQSAEAPTRVWPGLTCSPAPCVLPPSQASEGGSTVTDPLIVANPMDVKDLLLGSVDFNCPEPSSVGFHLSRDGGSTWKRVECMPVIDKGGYVYWPGGEPSVGYDHKGNAFIGGGYGDSEDMGYGFFAIQKSADDGTHWGKPVIALNSGASQYAPYDTWMTVDAVAGSPRANSLYVSGIVGLSETEDDVLVSHSTDGGATWKQVVAHQTQNSPGGDASTGMAVGKDGTVYLTWMYCREVACFAAHVMFSKSTDGGNTWSAAQRIAGGMPQSWQLPNTGEAVYNYPAIGIDDSDGPYSGNLYVAMYTWTGTYLQVQMIRSTDGGSSWSEPLPVAPRSDTHDQFLPSLSVSPTGEVGVSWLDRRNSPPDIDYQAFAAISADGGRSFQRNWQLTKAFSNPKLNGIGEYSGSTWAGEDFIAAWIDSSNGVDMQEVVGGVRLK
ncbi:MAG TPA: sialidase family protein [Terriglobales bacterium]|nr:sialidase family protein [Terriglobales bacterium]